MGPPPKKGRNFDPQYWSGWKDTPSCHCSNEDKIAYKYEWITVQMVSDAASGWQTTGRVFLGFITLGITEVIDKKDLTHECVVVWYKCNNCDHKFAIQYEIISEEDGKVMNYGHYERRLKVQSLANINYSFDFVQECYDKMWQNYRTCGHNCYHWAKDFSCKLGLANSDAYRYGYSG